MLRTVSLWMVCLALIACVDEGGGGLGGGGEGDTGGARNDRGTGSTDGGMLGADGGCAPSAERCDGEDNDCDGVADEDFPLGDACNVQVGGCTVAGVWACSADATGATCDAPPPVMEPEACNGADDDCDGAIDEDFDLATDAAHCGACDRSCDFDNALGGCAARACFLDACVDGFGDADADPTNGCECAMSNGGTELCNGQDEDCDGDVDEDFALGRPCSAGDGLCAAEGVTVCGDDGAIACSAQALPGSPETCNGMDDDCDGAIDETFDADGDGFPACPNVNCNGACPAGVDCDVVCPRQDCQPMNPDVHPGAAEICEDGIDQNCDGRDISCEVPAGRMTALSVATGTPAGCRDQDGDGRPDNAFGNALLTGTINGPLQDSVNDGSLNLMPVTIGLEAPGRDGVFDLGIVVGSPNGANYVLQPDSVDENGNPLMLFPGARVAAGAMVAGPGDFLLSAPVQGQVVELRVQQTQATGQLSVAAAGVTVDNGWLTGVVTEEDLQAGLVIVPEEFRGLIGLFLQPDIDLDGDGRDDAYSACVQFTVRPATLLGFPVQ